MSTATCKRCGAEFEFEVPDAVPASIVFRPPVCSACDAALDAERLEEEAADARSRARETSNVPQRYWEHGFESFRPHTRSQRDALRICRECAMAGVYLSGKPGCGKTHLAAAAIIAAPPGSLFVGIAELLDDIKAGFDGAGRRLFARAQHAPLLAIDDLGIAAVTGFSLDRIYTLLNVRWNAGLPLIVTTNCPPEVMVERIGPGATSRVIGLCAERLEVTGPDGRANPAARLPGLEKAR